MAYTLAPLVLLLAPVPVMTAQAVLMDTFCSMRMVTLNMNFAKHVILHVLLARMQQAA